MAKIAAGLTAVSKDGRMMALHVNGFAGMVTVVCAVWRQSQTLIVTTPDDRLGPVLAGFGSGEALFLDAETNLSNASHSVRVSLPSWSRSKLSNNPFATVLSSGDGLLPHAVSAAAQTIVGCSLRASVSGKRSSRTPSYTTRASIPNHRLRPAAAALLTARCAHARASDGCGLSLSLA